MKKKYRLDYDYYTEDLIIGEFHDEYDENHHAVFTKENTLYEWISADEAMAIIDSFKLSCGQFYHDMMVGSIYTAFFLY